MRTTPSTVIFVSIILAIFIISCNENKPNVKETQKKQTEFIMSENNSEIVNDKRMSLKLNPMQKNHQLTNMRDHLEAVQTIITLLSSDKYDEASKVAYTKLGSTTKMKLMCASFGDKNFETLGLKFHESADKMSEIFKSGNKEKSLNALSNTMNYCIQCHATYRQ